ncbi:MAG: adenylate/guanylate cyclase domain-containing protein [Leptospiraceae bacterium]|nr:adenylate/guanylate cyclase domain-containing protein [Leptospiraceae bacterium]
MKNKIYIIFTVLLLLNSSVLFSDSIQIIDPSKITFIQTDKENNSEWYFTAKQDINFEKESTDFSIDPFVWKKVEVPGDLVHQGAIEDGRKVVWYKKVFRMEDKPHKDLSIKLGEISDKDKVYLNGVYIGGTGNLFEIKPEGYDKQRIYDIPDSALRRDGENILLIQVKGFFQNELGIYRDRVFIGPTKEIWKSFYIENMIEVLILMVYLAVGGYFMLFFIRRRNDRENFYFALFLFSLVGYSFLRTQWKYEIGINFYEVKRVQYTFLWILFPSFYYFLRHYFRIESKKFIKVWDYIALATNITVILSAISIYIIGDAEYWNTLNNTLIQPLWIVYTIGSLVIFGISIYRKQIDAWLMIFSFLILLTCMVLDVLTARAIINLPTTATFGFIFFVLSIALILANRFVRLHDETESLNSDLIVLNKATSRFVPFEFLKILEKHSITEVSLGDNVQKEMTVLFSDIRSFTTLSESMSPQENFYFINSYLNRMGPIIRNHNGFIDKYIGDAVMALFSDSPNNALESAIEMQKTVIEHNVSRVKRGFIEITIGIGLHKGNLMLGTIGESERMDGTVISDAVNLASRLEGLTKYYGASIILSGQTLLSLENKEKYNYRFIDKVIVKGKKETVDLYEFYDGEEKQAIELKNSSKTKFSEALDAYIQGDFSYAKLILESILQVYNDGAAKLYLTRCNYYLEKGKPEDWNGITAMELK